MTYQALETPGDQFVVGDDNVDFRTGTTRTILCVNPSLHWILAQLRRRCEWSRSLPCKNLDGERVVLVDTVHDHCAAVNDAIYDVEDFPFEPFGVHGCPVELSTVRC
jgi:hypothetical protein